MTKNELVRWCKVELRVNDRREVLLSTKYMDDIVDLLQEGLMDDRDGVVITINVQDQKEDKDGQ